MISAQVLHRQGDFVLDVSFEAGSGVTALFGPSGSGKTSLVQMMAGLTRPDDARISFDGNVWNDTDRRIFVPPHRRRIGYVFQEGRLFPHLTARQREVLMLVVTGSSNKEIGRKLGLSPGTIKAHLSAIMRQFSVNNRVRLLLELRNQGFDARDYAPSSATSKA